MLSNVLAIGLVVQVILLTVYAVTAVGTKEIRNKLYALFAGSKVSFSLKTSQKEELLLVNDCLVLPYTKTDHSQPTVDTEAVRPNAHKRNGVALPEVSWVRPQQDMGTKKPHSKIPRSKLAVRLDQKRQYFLEAGGNLLPTPPLFARIANKVAFLESLHQKRLSKRGSSILYPVKEN